MSHSSLRGAVNHALWRAKRALASSFTSCFRLVHSAASCEARFLDFANPRDEYLVLVDLQPRSPVGFFGGPSGPLVCSVSPGALEAPGCFCFGPLENLELCIRSGNCSG
eukprot:1209662-Pyramimonas_sp.AAC.1